MKKKNFTLIEILGVVALIVILLTISIGAYNYAMDASKESATKATVARLSNGLTALQDKGFLQKTSDFEYIIFDAANEKLTVGTADLGSTPAKKKEIYKLFAKAIDADSVEGILDSDKKICDGWGQPILIRFPGKFNKGKFDIISAGSDGKFGSGSADTPPTDIASYRDSDNEAVCDDITNF